MITAAGVLEGQMKANTGSLTSLSAQQLVDCSEYDGGCAGGNYYSAFQYIVENNGLQTDTNYPVSLFYSTFYSIVIKMRSLISTHR